MWKDFFRKKNSAGVRPRELWLDIAKFFGILIVVLNHMELNIPLVTYFGGMFYMPLFFVTAGYTYRKREETLKSFALKKAKRLLLPYAFCNLALFAFYTLRVRAIDKWALLGIFYSRSMLMAADTPWNIGLMFVMNAPTWFLTCLFLCLCIYFLLDHYFETPKKRRLAVLAAMAAGMIAAKLSPVLLPWNLENALYCLGFVELGRTLKDGVLAWLRSHEWIYGNIFIAFVVFALFNGSMNLSISVYGKSMLLAFVSGALGSLLCMKAAEHTERFGKGFEKPMAYIGQNTLQILCWHLLVIEIIKKVLTMIGL